MIDLGLALSVGIAVVLPLWAFGRLRSRPTSHLGTEFARAADDIVGPAVAGMIVGRALTLLVEHPAGLVSPLEFVSVSAGIEFWPAVAAGVVIYIARYRPALMLPSAVIGLTVWGLFASSCVLRGSCVGPASSFGIVPNGLSTPVLPVGIAAGVGALGLAAALYRWSAMFPKSDITMSGVALVGLAAIRLIAALATPRLADEWNRSMIGDGIALATGWAIVVLGLRGYRARWVSTRPPTSDSAEPRETHHS